MGHPAPPQNFGATVTSKGVHFALWSEQAAAAWVSIFDASGDKEIERVALARGPADIFQGVVPGIGAGTRYGFRTDGPYAPAQGDWFDPAKLLMDPHAYAIDRAYRYDAKLAAPRDAAIDTAPLMPKAIVTELPQALAPGPPCFTAGGLIYELSVRAFTMRHPDIAEGQRGTIAALAHPSVIAHLKKIGVSAIELMPVTAWIDERHLPPHGLSNAWGYNPVSFMALDPRLAPGGIAELRDTVKALHDAGIGVLLDIVFNHSGESDMLGPTLSLRGIDARAYFRTLPDEPGRLANDSGCGNTIDCDHPATRHLLFDTLRHFVQQAGIDGFRFDLAPILGRARDGFEPEAAFFRELKRDPILSDRVLIAEPWDIGPGGYQLGNFTDPFLEWNDRYRDEIRRFWRGDPHGIGDLATRLAGSSEIFWRGPGSRSVNFVAAHDGFALADVVAYQRKHNHANGEMNRDGHDGEVSWNNGVEGPTDDTGILAARRRDIKALLSTLFASRGSIMLTAGDEFGRSQQGNNNAYCQDNELTWLDWANRDTALEDHVAMLAAIRTAHPALSDPVLLAPEDVDWLRPDGQAFGREEWHAPHTAAMVMLLHLPEQARRIAVAFNRTGEPLAVTLPGDRWRRLDGNGIMVDARSAAFFEEDQA